MGTSTRFGSTAGRFRSPRFRASTGWLRGCAASKLRQEINEEVPMVDDKRVGIWIRVSTEDQAKGESPEHHERHARFIRQMVKEAGVSSIVVAAVILTVAMVANAQQPTKVPRIGFLSATSLSTISARIEALR